MLGQGLRQRTRILRRPALRRRGAVRAAHRRDGAGPRHLGHRLAASQRQGDAERRRPGRPHSPVRAGAGASGKAAGEQSRPALRIRNGTMTALAMETRRTTAWWKELWIQVLIAMAIGVALGILHPDLATKMQPFGDAFIKAIRMLIAPIISCTVVHGIAHMADMARVGRVALKTIIYFEIITTIALVISLVMVNLLKPGARMNIDPTTINPSVIEPYGRQN